MQSTLLSPFSFRNGKVAQNRVALAPMTNLQSHADGTLSDDELGFLLARAEGGFGVITTCAAHVSSDGQGWPGELGISDDAHLPGLTKLATALGKTTTVSIVQIFHGGARADAAVTGQRPVSASEIEGDPNNPRAATASDIERFIHDFESAAVRASRAGFSGVELHGAHGYLLSQFLSRTMNQRQDDYGGSFENRARLLREVVRSVRKAVPASFVVGVRLSPEDFGQAKGLDLDESLLLSRWLAEDGIDFLHISLWDCSLKTKKRPDEHPIPLFRSACPSEIPLVVAGKIWTPKEAQTLLDMGADVVALGRAGISNPDWPKYAQSLDWSPSRPPHSPNELRERALSDTFINYLRRFKGFVRDEAAS